MEEDNETRQLSLHDPLRLGGKTAAVIVMTGSAVGQMFPIDGVPAVLGREPGVTVLLNDSGISRQHAVIARVEDGSVVIRDLGSRNGTFVNAARVEERTLADGDRIQLGALTILKFAEVSDVEQRFQQHLYESATHDALTRAFNRRYFDEELTRNLSHALRHERELGLIVLDVDHFKRVNDVYGHQAGDEVLRQIGGKVREWIRKEDVFCRIGGEEFAVILRDASPEMLHGAAERLRRLIERTKVRHGEQTLAVTVSIGGATYDPDRDETHGRLLDRADQALYQAKRSGRNRTCLAS